MTDYGVSCKWSVSGITCIENLIHRFGGQNKDTIDIFIFVFIVHFIVFVDIISFYIKS